MMLYTSIFGLGVNLIMVFAIHYDHFVGSSHSHSHGHSHEHEHGHGHCKKH